MLGLGIQPAGVTLSGIGQPTPVPALPSTARGARLIGFDGNPILDPINGGFLKADPLLMRAYLALRTTIGSAGANQQLGTKWPKKIDQRFDEALRVAVNTGLSALIASGELSLESVTYSLPRTEMFVVYVGIRNLVTQKSSQITVQWPFQVA